MILPLPRSLPALGAAALVMAGCGGTDTGGSAAGGADPASVMPKNAPVYVEAVIQPEGEQEEQVRALLSKVLRTDDPGARIKELIDGELADGNSDVSFEKDLEPWLGERVAVTVTDLAAEDPAFTAAVSVKDAEEAAEFVAGQAREEKAQERSYKDANYFIDDEKTAAGVVEDFLVVADTEADFKRAVDTAGGEGLDAVPRFEEALEGLPEERLGTFYLDPQLFGDAAAASAGDEAAAGVIQSALEGVGAVTAFAQATADTATIESRAVVKQGAGADIAALGSGAAPELLQSLPEDAWVALALGRVGESVRTGLESIAGGLGTAVLGGQLEQQTGLRLQEDVLSWIGDLAVFVRGDSLADIGGAVVATARDTAAAERALPRLAAAARRLTGLRFEEVRLGDADQAYATSVPGLPGPVVLGRLGDRVTLAVGEKTARAALDPSATLGDSPLYARVEESLDDIDPTLILDGPTAVELLSQAAAGDPDFAMAKPYLDMLDLLAAGAGKEGDAVRQRLTVRVK